jgi:phage baseplate assembly protein gpV
MSDEKQGLRNLVQLINDSKQDVTYVSEALVTKVRKKDKRVELTLLPDLEEIGWVRLYMLNAKGGYSSGQLPEVDTTVLVLFPNGDPRNAICLSGGYCEAGELGYEPTGDHDVVFTDKYGNKVLMEETGITIEDKSGNKIITTSSKITIEASSAMDIKSTGNMSIDSTGSVSLSSSAGSVNVNGALSVNINSDIPAASIKLGDGTAPIARVGDQVATPMGPGVILGTVTGLPNLKVFV